MFGAASLALVGLAGAATAEVFRELQRLAAKARRHPALAFRALVAPAVGVGGRLLAAAAALAILAANYVWVLRSDAAFEEASAAHAEKRASESRRPGGRQRRGRTPFTLAAAGPPETAVLWKNLIR